MDPDKRNAWLRKVDEECPYQVVLPRGQLSNENEILKFLTMYVGKFDVYVEDDYAIFVRYCFEDSLDAAISARGSSQKSSALSSQVERPLYSCGTHRIVENRVPAISSKVA